MAEVVTTSVTLQEARQRVFDLINERAGDGQFSVARVDAELNSCARRIFNLVNREDLDAERSTADGVYAYELPDPNIYDGRAHVSKVYIDLSEITAAEYEPVDETADKGEPSSFAVVGNTVYLYPTPDGVYEMKVLYDKEYTTLSSPSSTFPLSDEQVDACVYWAAYVMKLMDEEYTAAGMFKSMYEDAFALATRQRADVYESTASVYYD